MIEDLGYRVCKLRLVSFAVALVTTIASGTISGQQSKEPELAWPDGFAADAPELPQWVEHVVKSPGIRIRLRIPQAWMLRPTTSSGDFVAIDAKSGYRIEIVETKPTTLIYDQPVSAERLTDSNPSSSVSCSGLLAERD